MSIIADTLKRLQSQSEHPSSQLKDMPLSRPSFNKGEGSGRHRKDSPFGFLLVVIGMTLTFSGLAIVAFWIGGHLDFGLTTNTQAHENDHSSLPSAINFPEDHEFVDPASDTQITAISEPPQLSHSATTPTNHGHDQPLESLETANTTFLNSQTHEESTPPASIQGGTINPLSIKTTAPTASQDQPESSRNIAQAKEDTKESTTESHSIPEEPFPTITSFDRPGTQIDNQEIALNTTNKINQSEDTNLVGISIEEELIPTEEYIKPDNSVTDSAPMAATLAALEARREVMNDHGTRTTALQPSPANRLHHAQQLIRKGKYDDGVALLSPLFHDPPVQWQPWFWMGTALLGKGQTEQADQFFLSGLARNDKIPQLWIQRALVAQQRGDYQSAIHELRQAESLEDTLPHIHLNMGYAYERLGNDRLANQYYGKFLKLSEGQPAFFSTRKKLFARLTKQTSPKSTTSFSPVSSPQP